MNFGLSSWSQPVCEEHFHFLAARADKTLEVEDLSIRGGEGNLQESDILGESCQTGGENGSRGRGGGKKKGTKSKREREGDRWSDDEEDENEDAYEDDDEDDAGENEDEECKVKVQVVGQGKQQRLSANWRFFGACLTSGEHQHSYLQNAKYFAP